jgi:hypothetical protein
LTTVRADLVYGVVPGFVAPEFCVVLAGAGSVVGAVLGL